MQSKYKISVEQSTATPYGYECECMAGGEPLDRFVSTDELLAFLMADAQGNIPQTVKTWNQEYQCPDYDTIYIPFEQWLVNVGLIGLDKTLADFLNEKENRTATYKPIPSNLHPLFSNILSNFSKPLQTV